MFLHPHEIASFDGPYRTVTLTGPVSLMRLCSTLADPEQRFGRFWFNANFFWKLLDALSDRASSTAELNHYMHYLVREVTAVSFDWNSLSWMFELAVPAGSTLEATVGRIKPQPFYSDTDPQRRRALSHEILVGGEFQYIVDLPRGSPMRRHVMGPRPFRVHRAGGG